MPTCCNRGANKGLLYVVSPGFEDDPTAVRTFDASSEEVGWL